MGNEIAGQILLAGMQRLTEHFCSTCKTKKGTVPLVEFNCQHHTCIDCIKNDPGFYSKYRLVKCQNCKKPTLLNENGQCSKVDIQSELKKMLALVYISKNHEEYYQWLRNQQIKILQDKIKTAKDQKGSLLQKFQKAVIDGNKILKEETIVRCQAVIHHQNKLVHQKETFEAQYPINRVNHEKSLKQSSNPNEVCAICFENEALYCINTCGHVCLCQNHENLKQCPICRKQGKVMRIYKG